MRRIWQGLALFVSLMISVASADAAKRVALVVGNNDYANVPKLERAVSDANAVGEALRSIGYEVVVGTNLSRRGMNDKLAELEKRIALGDIVFFYYAGHGVALGAENVLLPVDMPAVQAGEQERVREEGITADRIVRRLQQKGAATTFMVLDACRNNPFEAGGTRDIGLTRGLAEVVAPKGVFVLYSAGINQTALDRLPNDSDANSVFTRKLIVALRQPGLSQVAIAKRMQTEVGELAATIQHDQVPAYYDQIPGEVMINPAPVGAVATAVVSPTLAPPPQPPVSTPASQPDAAAEWADVKNSNSTAAILAFIARHPKDTVYQALAVERLAVLTPKPANPLPAVRPPAPPQPPETRNTGPDVGSFRFQLGTYHVPSTVAAGVAILRSGPGVNHDQIAAVPPGAGGIRLGRCTAADDNVSQRDWCQAKWQGMTGWLSTCCIVKDGSGNARAPSGNVTFHVPSTIPAGVAVLRSGPGVNHDAIVSVPPGASGIRIGQCVAADDGISQRNWCRANWRGYSGWLSSCCFDKDRADNYE